MAAAAAVLMDGLISLIGFIKAERGLVRRDAPETTICPTKHLSTSCSDQLISRNIRIFRVLDVTVWFPADQDF